MIDAGEDEMRCWPEFTAAPIVTLGAPSLGSLVFIALFCAGWFAGGLSLPVLMYWLAGLGAIYVLRGVILFVMFRCNPWQVRFRQDTVEFVQGGRSVATVNLKDAASATLSVIDDRFPRVLQVRRADGSVLETLQGVARTDLETVIACMKARMPAGLSSEGERRDGG